MQNKLNLNGNMQSITLNRTRKSTLFCFLFPHSGGFLTLVCGIIFSKSNFDIMWFYIILAYELYALTAVNFVGLFTLHRKYTISENGITTLNYLNKKRYIDKAAIYSIEKRYHYFKSIIMIRYKVPKSIKKKRTLSIWLSEIDFENKQDLFDYMQMLYLGYKYK